MLRKLIFSESFESFIRETASTNKVSKYINGYFDAAEKNFHVLENLVFRSDIINYLTVRKALTMPERDGNLLE